MLDLKNVHTHYGLSHVLQGVTVSVGVGEVVGLFGRNGVGKTTVMKTIVGWVAPSSGSIHFCEHPIAGLDSDEICRMGLGFVPEDRRIFPGLSVEENIRLGFLQCPERPARASLAKLEGIYDRLPRLKERRNQVATTLSGGEQQMLAMARVLAGEPKLLLIDEPTEGLSPKVVEEIFGIIEKLRGEGIPILLVEQNVHRALDICSRFYALERGQVVFDGNASVAGDRKELLAHITV